MKIKIYALLTLFVLGMLFMSCDDSNNPKPEDEDPVLAKLKNTEWTVSKVYVNNVLDEQSDYSGISIKFTGEDSYTYTLVDGTVETGKFTLNSTGNTISLKNESWSILELGDSKFIVEFGVESEKLGNATIKIEFVKV